MKFTAVKLTPKWQTVISSVAGLSHYVANTDVHYLKLIDGDQLRLVISKPHQAIKDTVIVMFHGLSGDERSLYMVRIAKKLIRLGHVVIRVNHRAATKKLLPLARQIYHAGKSEDIYAVLAHVAKLYPDKYLIPIGFSISGNMLLKALAEYKDEWDKTIKLKKAIAIAPPMDLEASINKLSQADNKLFDRHFAKRLYKLYKYRAQIHNLLNEFNVAANKLSKEYGVYEIDEYFTAKEAGYPTAKAYYLASSAKGFLSELNVKTHVICDQDDPFVDNNFAHRFHHDYVDIEWTAKGGHMGYLAQSGSWQPFIFWLDRKIIALIESDSKVVHKGCKIVRDGDIVE